MQALTLDVIGAEEASTLPGLFRARCARSPDAIAYREWDEADQGWRDWTWREAEVLVDRWRAALAGEGYMPGERVAILVANGTSWMACDIAAQSLGLIVVPLYLADNVDSIAFVLGHSGASFLAIDSAQRWEMLARRRVRFPALRRVVVARGGGTAPRDGIATTLDDWLPQQADPGPHDPQPGELATIVYTSGTTGRPKGVMLSHRNILSNADAVLRVVHAYREDVFLSFLPLSHMFERTVGYYVPMMAGSTIAYARSLQTLGADMQTVRPTVLVSVPRIYEQAFARIGQMLERKGRLAKAMFGWAARIGWQRFEARQRRGSGAGLSGAVAWPVLDRLVARKVLDRFGGRLRLAVSGGAALGAPISHALLGLGVPLLQGYGLTETSPIVSGNRVDDNVPESVGAALPGIEVALGHDDELLVRGPNVMIGYWENPEATRLAIDRDDWFHTGDKATIDEDGRIRIVGRIKEIIVMSSGEKVPPADVELAIQADPLFAQAMVVGEGRAFIGALLVFDAEAWPGVAAEAGVDPADPASLSSRAVRRLVLSRLGECLKDFPGYARVRAYSATLSPWTIEDGLLTPTLKLKRNVIEERHAAEIAALYDSHGSRGGDGL